MKVDFEENNKRVMSLPIYSSGFKTPLIVPELLAKKMVRYGDWDDYKDSVIVAINLTNHD